MADIQEFDQEKEFDAIMAAATSGDVGALDKLMESEPIAITVVQDPVIEVTEPVVTEPVVTEPEVEATEPVVTEPVVTEPVVTDPVAELEALRTEVHRLRSDAGRVPFTQRRIKELETEVASLRAIKGAVTAAGGSEQTELDAETKAVIDELREIDPVMAKALEVVARKNAAAVNSKVTTAFNEFSNATQEADDERHFAEQFSLLTSQIPQAPQIFASNEWKQWKQGLSPGRRAMAESTLADEVATAIYAFAADMQRVSGTPHVQAPSQPAVVSQPNEAVQQAINERNRKVTTAAEVPQAAAKVLEEFDEDKAYLEMYKQIANANHIK